MKVLHVNYALERGGIETWLERLVGRFDPGEYQFALAYHRVGSAIMAADLRAAGFTLYPLPSPRSPWRYLRSYRTLLRSAGPFDAVHSHLNFAGLLMRGAYLEGVPVRIAHSHVSPSLMTKGLFAGPYVRATNHFFLGYMTTGIGVSPDAARTLFGDRWWRNPLVRLEPCGIDLESFESAASADQEGDLDRSGDDLVMAMIGRLSEEKNQVFALELIAEMSRAFSGLRLLLIGSGEMRDALQRRVRELGIEGQVSFLGERRDVPALLRKVIDVLLLPSLTEGSPLTLIEAQAAGVPCVVSTAVPSLSVTTGVPVERISLDRGLEAWGQAVLGAAGKEGNRSSTVALRDSPYDIAHNAKLLDACYRAGLQRATRRPVRGW